MKVDKALTKLLNDHIYAFCIIISKKYDMPLENLLNSYCDHQELSYDVFSEYLKITKKQKKISLEKESIIEEDIESEDNNSISIENNKIVKLCEYIYTKGSKKGSRCTINAKNGNLCCRHKK